MTLMDASIVQRPMKLCIASENSPGRKYFQLKQRVPMQSAGNQFPDPQQEVRNLMQVQRPTEIFLLMHRAECDLNTWILNRRYTATTLVRILFKVYRIMHGMHSVGICHNDLKPENVLVFPNTIHNEGECDAELTDFGLSCKFDNFGALQFPSCPELTKWSRTEWLEPTA